MAEYVIPEKYFYTKGDTWAAPCGDGNVRIGITDYAQKKLKSIEYLTLPDEDDEVEQSVSLGEVESKKSVSELLSPVSGTVVCVNEAAADDPALLNRDPFGDGWILEVRCPDYEEQVRKLMNAASYADYISEREH